MYKYFKDCKTLEEVKKVYKEKAKQFHPDVNPNIDLSLIIELNNEYEKIQKDKNAFIKVNKTKKSNKKSNKDLNNKISIYKKIQELHSVIKQKGYKPYSLVHKFIEYCRDNEIEISIEHLIYIRGLLGYKAGWEKFEYEKLVNNK